MGLAGWPRHVHKSLPHLGRSSSTATDLPEDSEACESSRQEPSSINFHQANTKQPKKMEEKKK